MRKSGKRMTDLSLPERVFLVLFLPFLVVHLAVLIPVVEWSCFCPDDDPHWSCCCNCPKCVKRRRGFKSYCHLKFAHAGEAEPGQGSTIAGLGETAEKKGLFKNHYVSLETLRCDCNGHIKRISIDLKPFLPSIEIPEEVPLPVVARIRSDDHWPPEAIPCHPEVPG